MPHKFSYILTYYKNVFHVFLATKHSRGPTLTGRLEHGWHPSVVCPVCQAGAASDVVSRQSLDAGDEPPEHDPDTSTPHKQLINNSCHFSQTRFDIQLKLQSIAHSQRCCQESAQWLASDTYCTKYTDEIRQKYKDKCTLLQR